jgi:ABC-type multidrug transport system ATPase subunit
VSTPVIEAKGLGLELGGYPILTGLDLSVAAGEIVAVLGDIGTGKTTFLRVLGGRIPPSSGLLHVLGREPRDDEEYRRDVVLAAGEAEWEPGATVQQQLEIARLAAEPFAETWPIPPELLEAFNIADRADADPMTLSQGLRQRLSLARALSRPSRVLLIDDPEFGLDTDFRPKLASLLTGYAARGGTVVMGTHDLELSTATGAREFSLD